MISFINQMGPFGWVLVLIALSNVVLAGKYAARLFAGSANTNVDLNGLVYLAGIGLAVSVLGHLLGVYQGLQIFAQLSTAQAAAGFGQSLQVLLLGWLIFLLTFVVWFVLRLRLRKLQSAAS